MVFVIHWHESAMELHVFPIPIPPPASLSSRPLWVFPAHQARAHYSIQKLFFYDVDMIMVQFEWNWQETVGVWKLRSRSWHIILPARSIWDKSVSRDLEKYRPVIHQDESTELEDHQQIATKAALFISPFPSPSFVVFALFCLKSINFHKKMFHKKMFLLGSPSVF